MLGMQGQCVGHLCLQPLEVRPHVAALRVEAARAVHEAESHGHQHLLDVEAGLREARREHRYVGHDHAVGPAVLNNAHELVEGGAHVAVGGKPRLARRRLRRHIGGAKPTAHPVIGGKVHDAAPSAVLARPGDTARRRQHVGEVEARHHATPSCLVAHAATGSPNRKTTSMSPPSPTSTLSMSSTTITRSRRRGSAPRFAPRSPRARHPTGPIPARYRPSRPSAPAAWRRRPERARRTAPCR